MQLNTILQHRKVFQNAIEWDGCEPAFKTIFRCVFFHISRSSSTNSSPFLADFYLLTMRQWIPSSTDNIKDLQRLVFLHLSESFKITLDLL